MVSTGLKSAQTLLNDKGIAPIKKLILLKNLCTKLIPQRSLEARRALIDKLTKLCDTSVIELTEEEELDLIAWVDENDEMNQHFASAV